MRRQRHAERTGEYLSVLLEQAGLYRNRWERRAQRLSPGGQINTDAVARVLADHLVRQGDGSGTDYRGLNDTVRRALRGDVLSAGTLKLFVDAFGMDEPDAARLYALFNGYPSSRVVSGSWRLPEGVAGKLDPAERRTIQLIESHLLGADGRPSTHETHHVVEATRDGVTNIPIRFDTPDLELEMIWGGVASEMYKFPDGLYGVDVTLTSPLSKGETAELHYRMNFFYTSTPPTELRRGAGTRPIRNLSLRVEFHPQRVPNNIWWGVWNDLNSAPLRKESVTLDSRFSAHRMVEELHHAIVGFVWDW